MSIETSIGLETGQPYPYQRVELVEPDWTRFPGWKDVTAEEWASVQWQRAHCVKNLKQLRELMGDLLDEAFYADLEQDQAERATMSMLVPPQMMNTMAPRVEPAGPWGTIVLSICGGRSIDMVARAAWSASRSA